MSPFHSFRWLIPVQGCLGHLLLWEGEAGLCELLWARLGLGSGKTQNFLRQSLSESPGAWRE